MNVDVARQDMERKSAAVTLSDMEIFIFPELMYSLVLANIMSPRLWQWREDAWFDGLDRMKPYRRITRLKQYIMDHYAFNLDLDTWGLTTKERELERFEAFVDAQTLERSNALFGYEGDKYYFDIDIRRHFGLDKYAGNIIPYWKTETLEAMDAFRHKENYETGAGECVSLAALYAAALFVVARIPLRDIYLMATPLHSQNFIDVDDGILTNNRRLVTKTMWTNGSALSAQARRALENERVTIVGHETGFVHTVYDDAGMDRQAYDYFRERLSNYLRTPITEEIIGNFLRQMREFQRCFQLRWNLHGVDHYIAMECVFAYEHGSPYRVTDSTRDKLLAEIENEDFQVVPLPGRIVLNDVESFVAGHGTDMNRPEDMRRLREQFASACLDAEATMESLRRFCCVEPRLPDPERKHFAPTGTPLNIDLDMERDDVVQRLADIRGDNVTADLAFYGYRDLRCTEVEPFLKAAFERNPVGLAALGHEGPVPAGTLDVSENTASPKGLADKIAAMPSESIYDGAGRLAQPDEVWNYGRGDGVEKALLLAVLVHHAVPAAQVRIDVEPDAACVNIDGAEYRFHSVKGLPAQRWTVPSDG